MDSVLKVLEGIASVGTVLAAIVAVVQIRTYVRPANEERQRLRRQLTIEAYMEMVHKPLIGHVRQFREELKRAGLENRGIAAETISANKELDSIAHSYLNEIEPFAAGVNLEIYDIETVYVLYGEPILRFQETLGYYPRYLAEQSGIETLYVEYRKMTDRLKQIDEDRRQG